MNKSTLVPKCSKDAAELCVIVDSPRKTLALASVDTRIDGQTGSMTLGCRPPQKVAKPHRWRIEDKPRRCWSGYTWHLSLTKNGPSLRFPMIWPSSFTTLLEIRWESWFRTLRIHLFVFKRIAPQKKGRCHLIASNKADKLMDFVAIQKCPQWIDFQAPSLHGA